MNAILTVPLGARLAVMVALGTCVGAAVNWAAYRLAWHPRPISPWGRPDPEGPPRRWSDRLPVVGWLGLRRETALHGPRFWIRPMAVEAICGVACAWLYWWEIAAAGLLPPVLPRPVEGGMLVVLHVQFAGHAMLMALMLAASLIDLDERIIPDAIVVPGTLAGLLLTTFYPAAALSTLWIPPGNTVVDHFWQRVPVDQWPVLQLASPNDWPLGLGGSPHGWALVAALGCWWLWCVGLMPRTWYPRHGIRRALGLSLARLTRDPATYRLLALGAVGSAGAVGVWFWGGPHWAGLLSALVGVAVGGGVIWAVRILGTTALGREAMGFGDVTLMAMIGAFLGWQTCLVVFFIAPFAGLVVGLLQLIVRRDSQIPYGPFLSLGAATAIVFWAPIWVRIWEVLAIGWLVPTMVGVCLGLMLVMLTAWRFIRQRLL